MSEGVPDGFVDHLVVVEADTGREEIAYDIYEATGVATRGGSGHHRWHVYAVYVEGDRAKRVSVAHFEPRIQKGVKFSRKGERTNKYGDVRVY